MIDRLFYATVTVALATLFALTASESARVSQTQATPVVQLERVVITLPKPAAKVAAAPSEAGSQPVLR